MNSKRLSFVPSRMCLIVTECENEGQEVGHKKLGEEELKVKLTPRQFEVTQQCGMENRDTLQSSSRVNKKYDE